ncbi:MAG: hypothetical protein ABW036_11800, partial [Flavitalea sp.]
MLTGIVFGDLEGFAFDADDIDFSGFRSGLLAFALFIGIIILLLSSILAKRTPWPVSVCEASDQHGKIIS